MTPPSSLLTQPFARRQRCPTGACAVMALPCAWATQWYSTQKNHKWREEEKPAFLAKICQRHGSLPCAAWKQAGIGLSLPASIIWGHPSLWCWLRERSWQGCCLSLECSLPSGPAAQCCWDSLPHWWQEHMLGSQVTSLIGVWGIGGELPKGEML